MTREEAIELLENLKVCRQAHTLFNIEKEAVDMAIEALKETEQTINTNQNPCINCCITYSCKGICEKRYLWNLRKECDEK